MAKADEHISRPIEITEDDFEVTEHPYAAYDRHCADVSTGDMPDDVTEAYAAKIEEDLVALRSEVEVSQAIARAAENERPAVRKAAWWLAERLLRQPV